MRIVVFLMVINVWLVFSSLTASSLEVVRNNYSKLVSDKELCRTTIIDLEKRKNVSNTYLAYLGGAQTVWASHSINPFSKLNTFKDGKKKIEQAIKNEPENIEIRYIRLSVQKNAPAFLGYKSNIKEDTEIIKQFRHQLNSKVLQKNIDGILK